MADMPWKCNGWQLAEDNDDLMEGTAQRMLQH